MLEQLPELLSACPPPLIHIHDPHDQLEYHSTLSDIQQTQRAYVSIDCIECLSQRVLFSRIVNGLANWTPSWDAGGECWGSNALGVWDTSFDTFAKALKKLWLSILDSDEDEDHAAPEAMVIVLRNAEVLKERLGEVLVPLTRLSELVSRVTLQSLEGVSE